MFAVQQASVFRGGRTILDCVDLELQWGELTVIVGPNGAGKSTLLKVLSGELKPQSGFVRCDGHRLETISAASLAERRAVVPQASHLSFPFSVIEVVMLGATVPGFYNGRADGLTEATDALKCVGMSRYSETPYAVLSGGEKQRVHIARALCQLAMARRRTFDPQCLFLDEPTSSLDLKQQLSLARALRMEVEDGRAVMMVGHDLNLAASIADSVVLLCDGRIVAAGSVSDVYQADLLSRVYDCPIDVLPQQHGQRVMVFPKYEQTSSQMESAAAE